jgi:hypothetical protein
MTTDRSPFERRLEARLDSLVSSVVRPFDPAAVTRRAAAAAGPRHRLGGWLEALVGGDVRTRRSPGLIVAALLALLLALVGSSALLVGTRATVDPTPPLRWPSLSLQATGSLAVPRQCHSAVRLEDGRVLVVGGRSEDGAVVTTPELYDPEEATFRALEGATAAGDGASATLLADGRVLVAGGRAELTDTEWPRSLCTLYDWDAGSEEIASAFLFDPSSGRLESTGALGTARSGHVAALLGDGRVLVAGGNGMRTDGTYGPLATAELYDPATGTFAPAAPMTVARGWQRALGGITAPTVVTLPDGRVVITGGSFSSDEQDPDAVFEADDVFDPLTDRFTRAVAGPTAVAAGPWVMLTNCFFPCMYRFDPVASHRSSEQHEPRGSQRRSFNGGSAWLLDGDRLLLVTGDSVSLHDLADGTSWTARSAVARYRRSATATALADGTVLIAGGSDVETDEGPSFVTGAAEIAGPGPCDGRPVCHDARDDAPPPFPYAGEF